MRSFTASELKSLKGAKLREKSPFSDQNVEWRGPLLGEVLSEALRVLSAEEKSQIDLVVLKGARGEQAWIPRAFLTKYPLLLAEPSWDSVVPSSSRPKLRDEDVPHSSYWVKEVRELELTSYRERFGQFYLKRRTDPAAIRGEKVFVQNCLACHHAQRLAPGSEKGWRHPMVPAYREMDARSQRALFQYWTAYQAEQGENR